MDGPRLNGDGDDEEHEFRAVVQPHDIGTLRYTVVYAPPPLHARFGSAPRVRVRGAVAGVDVDGAFQRSHGKWFLMLGRALLREAGVSMGELVDVRFRLVPPDEVDVPDELLRAMPPAARRTFAALTAGKQRALAHRVRAAKTPATRTRRVAEVVAALATADPLRALGHGRHRSRRMTRVEARATAAEDAPRAPKVKGRSKKR